MLGRSRVWGAVISRLLSCRVSACWRLLLALLEAAGAHVRTCCWLANPFIADSSLCSYAQELLEAARAHFGDEYREDGPPLGFEFDDEPVLPGEFFPLQKATWLC